MHDAEVRASCCGFSAVVSEAPAARQAAIYAEGLPARAGAFRSRIFLQAQRSELVRVGAELGDHVVDDAENEIVVFPLGGDRRVAGGVQGAQFGLPRCMHGFVSGGQCSPGTSRVERAVAGEDFERQESVFIGLKSFCFRADVVIVCHFSPREMELSEEGLPA